MHLPDPLKRVTLGGFAFLYAIPVLLFLVLHQYGRLTHWRDSHSPYFDPSRAYQHIYSDVRSEEVDYMRDHDFSTKPFKRTQGIQSPPYICLGMLTIARPNGTVYFRTSLASAIAGLTQQERDELYVMPFVTHTDPTIHPAWGEPWLENISDRVLLYNETAPNYQHIKDLEIERDRTGVPDREKHMADYIYLMRQCAATGAPYVLMMEDDTLALDGWFHRAKAALHETEVATKEKGDKDFFYLRLFYHESIMARTDESTRLKWQRGWMTGALIGTIAFFVAFRKRPLIRNNMFVLFTVTYLTTCVLIYHYWYGWHISGMPTRIGANEMGGCCAQAIIFPTTKVEMLTNHYEEKRIGFVDTIAEELWSAHPEITGAKWGVHPSLFQHIGMKSSKGDNWGSDKPGQMSAAERIWNFEFEMNDKDKLRKEHEQHSRSGMAMLRRWMQ